MNLLVPESEKNSRLDHFLVKHLTSLSRSAIQKMIKNGSVTINRRSVSVHHFLKAGDHILVLPPAVQGGDEEGGSAILPILFEDDDITVVDKPSGLVVHGGPGVRGSTLVDALLRMRPAIVSVGDDKTRPGIVHRLDADVSGALIVAKTNRAFDDLKRQFKERTVKKVYTALVIGRVAKDEGTLEFAIGRSRRRGRMAARPVGGEGKEAKTHYEVIKRFPNATLLRVQIETGRTHQIRAHFHALGHPIAGDARYRIKSKALRKPPPRLFLHATEIEFHDMKDMKRTVTSHLPNELNSYLNLISRSHAPEHGSADS